MADAEGSDGTKEAKVKLYDEERDQTREPVVSCSKGASLSHEISSEDLSIDSQQEVVESGQSMVQLPAAELSNQQPHGHTGEIAVESQSPGAAAVLLHEHGELHSKGAAKQIQMGDAAASQASQGPTDSLEAHGTSGGGRASPSEHDIRTTPAHMLLGTPQGNVRAKQLDCLRFSDFAKYRKFVQKWLQRKSEKQQQQQRQTQPKGEGQRGAHLGGSVQGAGHGMDMITLHGVPNLPQAHSYTPHHKLPTKAQDYHPLQGGSANNQETSMAAAERRAAAFATTRSMQPPVRAVRHSSAVAKETGDAIDLTDDSAVSTAAQPSAIPHPETATQAQPATVPQYQAYAQSHLQHDVQHQHQQYQYHSGAYLRHLQIFQKRMAPTAAVAPGLLPPYSHQINLNLPPYAQQARSVHALNLEAGRRQLPVYEYGYGSMAKKQRIEGKPQYEERPGYEADGDQAGTVTFSLISTSHFTAKIRRPTPATVHTYFKLTPGATYDEKERRWKFPLGAHENLAGALSRQGVQVVPVPRQALAAATLAVGPAEGQGDKEANPGDTNKEPSTPSVKLCQEMVPGSVLKILAPFQKEGVEFVLKKEGRAMIADEMGLGKTVQAIACAAAYESEWPLLIICPSSARYHWEHELLKWLDKETITKKEIAVVSKSKQDLNRRSTKVVIISYDLVSRMKAELDLFGFGVVICDECHYLKNQRAARTKAVVPLGTKARRAILLSGTPALSRPSELFTQLNLLCSSTWSSFKEFGRRYCAGRKCKRKRGKVGGVDYSGASHIAELHALLRATVMVRRLKKNILKHLPPKQRSLVEVPVEDDKARQALYQDLKLLSTRDALLGRLAKEHSDSSNVPTSKFSLQQDEGRDTVVLPRPPKQDPLHLHKGKCSGRQPKVVREQGGGRVTKLSAPLKVASPTSGEWPGDSQTSSHDVDDWASMTRRELAQERRSLLMKLFADTGTAKIPAVLRHVSDILADEMTGGKVLVFAHHRNVLNALEDGVLKTGRVEYIRIDGSTKPKDRQDLVDTFQSSPSVRVALLGLTAAGIGITLTAASRVVFAELYWTPAQLLQAEDRCHRIGQATVVKVQYLVAKGSLDDALWPLIQQKIKLLGEMVEGQGENNQMEVHHSDSAQIRSASTEEPSSGASAIASEVATANENKEDNCKGSVERRQDETKNTCPAFQMLQASVMENAQELAVEDMRHELDDETRRELFEEEDGFDSRGGDGSEDYSSGYSDGGGGLEEVESVYDIIDSDEEYGKTSARQASRSFDFRDVSQHTSRCSKRVISAGAPQVLTAAITAAKASAAKGTAAGTQNNGSTALEEMCSKMVACARGCRPDDAIDLLSGDEGDAPDSDDASGSGLVVVEDADEAGRHTPSSGEVAHSRLAKLQRTDQTKTPTGVPSTDASTCSEIKNKDPSSSASKCSTKISSPAQAEESQDCTVLAETVVNESRQAFS